MSSDGRFETIEDGKPGNVGKDGKHFKSWVAQHLHGRGVTLRGGQRSRSVSFIIQ
jgi:hypothetical protein